MRWDFILYLAALALYGVSAWSAALKWQVRGSRILFWLCLSLILMELAFALTNFLPDFRDLLWVHTIMELFSIIIPLLIFFLIRETHPQQKIEQDLKEGEATFRVLFENGPDAIILTDFFTMIILDCNENACRMNGRKREEMVGQHINILHQQDSANQVDNVKFKMEVALHLASEKTFLSETNHRYPDGSLRVIETHMRLVTYRGRLALMGIDRDITDRKTAEQQVQKANETLAAQIVENQKLQELLREQALRDPLTGLYNRRFLQETLDRELARARRAKVSLSVLMLDVDFFKNLNDTYGHTTGDMVLQAIANLLQEQFREMDVPCRYGGEEFLVVIPTADCQTALKRAEMLCQLVTTLRIPDHEHLPQVTVSVGVASFPEHASSGEALLQAADEAMYAAKQAGRNTVRAA